MKVYIRYVWKSLNLSLVTTMLFVWRLTLMYLSLFREVYPREMFKELEKSGLEISEQYPGIYYVTGNIPVPAQVIVTSRLSPENHSSLRILSVKADKADVERFLRYARLLSNQGDRNNVDAVLQASVSANFELYEEVRRGA